MCMQSHARMPDAWAFRNFHQVGEAPPRRGAQTGGGQDPADRPLPHFHADGSLCMGKAMLCAMAADGALVRQGIVVA